MTCEWQKWEMQFLYILVDLCLILVATYIALKTLPVLCWAPFAFGFSLGSMMTQGIVGNSRNGIDNTCKQTGTEGYSEQPEGWLLFEPMHRLIHVLTNKTDLHRCTTPVLENEALFNKSFFRLLPWRLRCIIFWGPSNHPHDSHHHDAPVDAPCKLQVFRNP